MANSTTSNVYLGPEDSNKLINNNLAFNIYELLAYYIIYILLSKAELLLFI